MDKIRVLVVDDSSTMRRIITDVLSADPELEVVGTAANGRIALEKLPELKPDVMTLDIEMPEMDGLQTVPHVKRSHSRLPIIMFSSLTEQGASHTLQALALGAADYVTKPTAQGAAGDLKSTIAEELIGKIKALTRNSRRGLSTSAPTGVTAVSAPQVIPLPSTPCVAQIVAVGVSTGGPNALPEVIGRLPKNFGCPIVVVQHMPPTFTKMFADRLNGSSELTVCEAHDGQELQPGAVYVAPGGYHMFLKRDAATNVVRVALNQDAPENSCRPAADVLFRSVAELYGERALAVVLTGMGQDGLRGCQAIAAAGGSVLAQDQATSVVWGMPGAVVNAGLARAVLPLDKVAAGVIDAAYGD